jgi:hypothetical protein
VTPRQANLYCFEILLASAFVLPIGSYFAAGIAIIGRDAADGHRQLTAIDLKS